MSAGNPVSIRSLAYLAGIFVAMGALWSGVKGGGMAFGALIGALVFAVVIGGSLLSAGKFPRLDLPTRCKIISLSRKTGSTSQKI
jgi:hypothetical protein